MKRTLSGQHFVEQYTDGPDICTEVDRFAPRLFGTHIGRCADGRTRLCQACRFAQLGNTKIQYFHVTTVSDHDIGRFDVPVDNSSFVRSRETANNLIPGTDGQIRRKHSFFKPVLQRLAIIKCHDDEKLTLGIFADIMDGTDVGVIQGRGRTCLLREAFLGGVIKTEVGRQKL